MDSITVLPLGISAGTPTRDRNVSSTALIFDGRSLLFDCGEGAQLQLIRSDFRFGRLEAIFITHLHGDHFYGVPGLLATLSMASRESPLSIYGPLGIRSLLEAIITLSHLHLQFELDIVEIAEEGLARTGKGYRVMAAPLDHRVRCFGFAFIEDVRPGRFDVERARSFGVPEGPLFGELQRGHEVAGAGGRMVQSAEVMGLARAGRRVAYCTDTRPCDSAVELGREADLLIHEATYTNDLAREAGERGHSTAAEAARIAVAAGARHLLLTHFSPRYADLQVLLAEAQPIFEATSLAEELVPWHLE